MPSDRDEHLRRAEKALRLGRIAEAMGEFQAVLASAPEDLHVLNALGDLYVRQQRVADAVPLYVRVADVHLREGFFSKAAGFYRKALKFSPDDELVQGKLAEALAAQGLVVEARSQLEAIARARRRRGDRPGELAILVRIADLDRKDVPTRLAVARLLISSGERAGLDRLLAVIGDLEEQGQGGEAVALVPELAEAAAAHGELPRMFDRLVPLVDSAVARGDIAAAMTMLRAVLDRAPTLVAAASRLVDLGIDAGLQDELVEAQQRLCQAYEASGRLAEARAVAEDLVLARPHDPVLRRRLVEVAVAMGEPDPEAVVARLLALHETVESVPAGTEPAPAMVEGLETEPLAEPGADTSVVDDTPLERVFDDMRAAVLSAGAGDGRQQVALGRTYLAAGMVAEARAALERAARDPAVRATAAVALGEIWEEEGDLVRAIEWYERGVDAPHGSESDRVDALRRLGRVLETAGEPERALAVWLELLTTRPDDEEASRRVSVLTPEAGR